MGDTVSLGPRQQLTVAHVEPPRTLVLESSEQGPEWVWLFGIYSLPDGRTRLVSRGTERMSGFGGWLVMRVIEPAAFTMTRRMLLGVKERAEASGSSGDVGLSR